MAVNVCENLIHVNGASVKLIYTDSFVAERDLPESPFAAAGNKSYLEDDGFEVGYCLVQYLREDQVSWDALFSATVPTKAIARTSHNTLFVKFGFQVHALYLDSGVRRWVYSCRYPILDIYVNERTSSIAFVSEVDVGLLSYDGEPIWSYSHRELIVDSFVAGTDIKVRDFDGRLYSITWLDGRAHRVEAH